MYAIYAGHLYLLTRGLYQKPRYFGPAHITTKNPGSNPPYISSNPPFTPSNPYYTDEKNINFLSEKNEKGVNAAPFFLSLNIYLFHVWAREKSPVIMLRFDRDCPQLYFYKLKFVNELKPD